MNNHHDDLHDDDQPVGRILTRREVLRLLGGSSAGLLAAWGIPQMIQAQAPSPTPSATPLPTCVVRPELTEGPFFVSSDLLERVDIRTDPEAEVTKAGVPLLLVFRVSEVTGGRCQALTGAQVDVWQCDADGQYSGVQDRTFDNREELWLRGYQLTDDDGIANFLTIVPGWYRGRAVHIHFKIRTIADEETTYDFTSQLFFEPETIASIYEEAPYTVHGLPDTPNDEDGIYRQSGDLLTLELLPLTDDELETYEVESGYRATFDIGLDLSQMRG